MIKKIMKMVLLLIICVIAFDIAAMAQSGESYASTVGIDTL